MASENGSRWIVDTTDEVLKTNFFKGAFDLITCADNEHVFGRRNGWVQEINNTEIASVRDFIIELVAEIERLQTENINAVDVANFWHSKCEHQAGTIANLRACANIDEALRPADGDTKWAERFKGLYGEGHYEPE